MTHWTEAADLLDEREVARQSVLTRYAPGALAFVLSASLGLYVVYLRPSAPDLAAPTQTGQPAPFGGLEPIVPAPSFSVAIKPSANPFGAPVVKGFGSGAKFDIAEAMAPLPPTPPATLRLSDDGAPLPPRRPNELARTAEPSRPAAPRLARLEPRPAAPTTATLAAPAPTPGLLARLFGGSDSSASKQPETRLAYAAPPPPASSGVSAALVSRGGLGAPPGGPGGFLRGLTFGSGPSPTSRFGDRVAVYDISARVVYLPDGTRLEAHSGLGESRDDPNRVSERMRGPTPPATYALTPRESLFHGVEALRLTPTDSSVFGRAGLLAHTYMLGAEGDSNGCISFRDYDAFLRAYRSGQINKLVVVTRL